MLALIKDKNVSLGRWNVIVPAGTSVAFKNDKHRVEPKDLPDLYPIEVRKMIADACDVSYFELTRFYMVLTTKGIRKAVKTDVSALKVGEHIVLFDKSCEKKIMTVKAIEENKDGTNSIMFDRNGFDIIRSMDKKEPVLRIINIEKNENAYYSGKL